MERQVSPGSVGSLTSQESAREILQRRRTRCATHLAANEEENANAEERKFDQLQLRINEIQDKLNDISSKFNAVEQLEGQYDDILGKVDEVGSKLGQQLEASLAMMAALMRRPSCSSRAMPECPHSSRAVQLLAAATLEAGRAPPDLPVPSDMPSMRTFEASSKTSSSDGFGSEGAAFVEVSSTACTSTGARLNDDWGNGDGADQTGKAAAEEGMRRGNSSHSIGSQSKSSADASSYCGRGRRKSGFLSNGLGSDHGSGTAALPAVGEETNADPAYSVSRSRVRSRAEKLIWFFLEDPDLVTGGRLFVSLFSLLIMISSFIPFIETQAISVSMTELVLDSLFLIEVFVRFFVCPNRITFFVNCYNVIDIISGILPILLRIVHNSLSLRYSQEDSLPWASLLMVCLVPIFRLLKLLRRFESFHLLIVAGKQAFEALPVLLYTLVILVLTFSALIYALEPRSTIQSMPYALWFTMVTVSTVGYGDITPSTPECHVVVALLIVVSALYMAIPIGIVGKAFGTVWDNRQHLLLMQRLRVRFATAGYKAEDIPAMFCSFDKNADGELTKEEFSDMMKQMEIELSGGRAQDLFDAFDNDGSGAIDDEEFVRTLFPNLHGAIYSEAGEEEGAQKDDGEEQ